jgi:hypothetical protein
MSSEPSERLFRTAVLLSARLESQSELGAWEPEGAAEVATSGCKLGLQ